MSVAKSSSRQRFIDAAARLLQQRGYHGTGLGDILRDSGAPRGSLYFHFPGGKEQLAAEAIAQGAGQVCAALQVALTSDQDIGDAVLQVFSMFGEQLRCSDFTLGCPVAPVALEQVEGRLIQDAVEAAFTDWHSLIVQRLRRDGHPPDRAEALATFALAAVEGALVLARGRHDLTPLQQTAQELSVLLSRGPEGTRHE